MILTSQKIKLIMKWFIKCLKQYADFNGRASRQEYWMFILFQIIFYFPAMGLDLMFGTFNSTLGIGIISFAYSLTILIPTLAVSIRRIHDIGKSGWIYFYLYGIPMILYFILIGVFIGMFGTDLLLMGEDIDPNQIDPSIFSPSMGIIGILFLLDVIYLLVGGIWLLILLIRKGDIGDNNYGPDPQ